MRGEHIKRNKLTDRKTASDNKLSAKVQDQDDRNFVDQLNGLTGEIVQVEDTKAGRDISRELHFPASLHLRLDSHGLECLNTRDAFDQECLVFGAAAEFFI